MANKTIHERQVSFFKNGHDHDGENSSLVNLQPGQVHLHHFDKELLKWIEQYGGTGSTEETDTTTSVMPVPDLSFDTVSVPAGSSVSGSVSWTGISVVRMMRVIMSSETRCDITFFHDATYDQENREFRAENCEQQFMWEGAWVHYDETGNNQIHYTVENTGNVASEFRIMLKSGTMVSNTYADFIESVTVGDDTITGEIELEAGDGIELSVTDQKVRFDVTGELEYIPANNWALVPLLPSDFTSSTTITNESELLYARNNENDYAYYGTGVQWLSMDLGAAYTLGRIQFIPYIGDTTVPRVYNDVKIELSSTGTSWKTFMSSTDVWGVWPGVSIEIPSGYNARYVRVWMNGSNVDSYNYIHKLVAFKITDKGH